MFGELVVVVVLASVALLGAVYWRVPAGPECPRCGTLAREAGRRGPPGERLLASAQCPVCGWNGRMRRRPPATAVASVRRRGRR